MYLVEKKILEEWSQINYEGEVMYQNLPNSTHKESDIVEFELQFPTWDH